MRPKVLVIDDDVVATQMVTTVLELGGFEALAANSGWDGIVAVYQQEPDAVLLDLMMPGMDGWQVCETIRKFSWVPILVLSGVVDADQVGRILEHGATDYLVKPVPRGVLLAKLKHLTCGDGASHELPLQRATAPLA